MKPEPSKRFSPSSVDTQTNPLESWVMAFTLSKDNPQFSDVKCVKHQSTFSATEATENVTSMDKITMPLFTNRMNSDSSIQTRTKLGLKLILFNRK